MKHELKPGEMITSVTVRIELYNDSDQLTSTGTVFFYSVKIPPHYIPVVITNKHVVTGDKNLKLTFTEADSYGNRLPNFLKYGIKDFKFMIVNHPDSTVDLCAIPLSPIVGELRKINFEIYTHFITDKILAINQILHEFDAIEEVITIGYPNQNWDSVNNLPITRRGITATDPKVNYQGNREFLADSGTVHGSSGSPVFVKKENKEFYLLGVLYRTDLRGFELTSTVDPLQKLPYVTPVYTGIGYAIKAERVLELEQLIRQLHAEGK